MARPSLSTVLLLVTLAAPLVAQTGSTRQTPGLGGPQQPVGLPNMPALPPLAADSPDDTLVYADRMLVGVDESDYPPGTGTVTPAEHVIDASLTGTGFHERVFYHVPSGYNASADPVPLVVAYHGFGASAASVGIQTTIDEHCEARGWFYLSVTGLDDKLFGTPVGQRHVDVAIEWMLDQYEIDPDRIYMVGFSMGGGVVANYAARHRDPDGIMIAAVAAVAGSFDWTMVWTLDPVIQAWFLSPYNFGGSPTDEPFAYQRSSSLYFDPATYPPIPATHLPGLAMATNLDAVPLYVTWDSDDRILYLPDQSTTLVALQTAAGGSVQARTVTGTTDPATGEAATHSWAVLDPHELFAFFDGKTVDRYPDELDLQLDFGGRVAWLDVIQRTVDAFTWIDARAGPGDVDVLDVQNAAEVTVHLPEAAPASPWPVRVSASSADDDGFRLGLANPTPVPGWFLDVLGKQLLQGQSWDPLLPSVAMPVPAQAALEVRAWPASWTGLLTMAPNPVGLGQVFLIDSSVAAGSDQVWLVIGLTEAFFWAPNGDRMVVSPAPPALILPFGVGPDGSLQIPANMPNDPVLSGLRLLFQGVTFTNPIGVTGITNPFSLFVE